MIRLGLIGFCAKRARLKGKEREKVRESKRVSLAKRGAEKENKMVENL